MRTLLVVKAEPAFQSVSQLDTVVERPEVKVLILERPPQSLDENVVLDPTAAIQADVDMMVFQ